MSDRQRRRRRGIAARGGMVVALVASMTTVSKLFWFGAVIGAGAIFVSRVLRARHDDVTSPEDAGSEDVALADERGAEDVVIPPALSQVDPVPLSQMSEAIDPDATLAAHRDIPEQRERLPIPGKNLP